MMKINQMKKCCKQSYTQNYKEERSMRKFLILLLSVLFIGLVACSSDSKDEEDQSEGSKDQVEQGKSDGEPQEGGKIVVGTSTEPESLDPHNTGQAAANIITGNIGGSLVFQNPETMEFEPYLAESWETSDDGKVWTFKLREGITFHDGSELTANDFVNTYERAQETSFVASGNLNELETAEAEDDYTLVLTLKEPFAPLLQYLSDPGWLQPLPTGAIEEDKDLSRELIGVGPWKFEEWDNGQSILLSKFEDYNWAPEFFKNNDGPVYADELEYKFIGETQTMLAALDSGSIDIAANVPANQIQQYLDNDDYYVLERPRNGLGLFIEFNLENPTFEQIEIREAINYAIDKESLLKAVLDGQGEVSYGALPSSFFGYDENVDEYGYHYDVEKAKELIESVGYTEGSDGIYEKDGEPLKVELMTQVEGESWMETATLLQAMLGQAGIDVSIDAREWGSLLETATNHQFEMTLMGYTYNDPDVLNLFLHSAEADGGLNAGSIKDDHLDELLEKGRKTVDQDERKEIYFEIQEYMNEQAYWAPLITESQYYVVNKDLKNLSLHPLLNLLFQDGWVE